MKAKTFTREQEKEAYDYRDLVNSTAKKRFDVAVQPDGSYIVKPLGKVRNIVIFKDWDKKI